MNHNAFRLGMFVLVGVLLAASANAATKNWATGDGNWSVGANWSPAGVPAATDDAKIVFPDTAARTVTYDYTGPAITLNSVTLDLTGGGNNSTKLTIAANSLSEAAATVGDTAMAKSTKAAALTLRIA